MAKDEAPKCQGGSLPALAKRTVAIGVSRNFPDRAKMPHRANAAVTTFRSGRPAHRLADGEDKMRHQFRFPIIATALVCASPLPAQQRPADDDSEIVIEGVRERERAVQRFVDALTDTPVRGQIARFDWKVCPAAAGLSREQGQQVIERMRQVAQAIGLEVGDADCPANALVIVTSDKAATLRWLRQTYPAYFRDGLGYRIPIRDDGGPATAWQVEGRLDQDGMTVGADSSAGDSGTRNAYVVNATRDASRITPATRPHFMASLVVIEADALRGLTTTQLADYAAMRLFARTEPSRLERSTAPTILNILDAPMDSSVPLSLTQWDLSFLRALYGSAENHYASQQRHEMRRLMGRDMDEAADSERASE
jgi:hypothetical protein